MPITLAIHHCHPTSPIRIVNLGWHPSFGRGRGWEDDYPSEPWREAETQVLWLVVVPVSGSLLATGTGYRALWNHSKVNFSAAVCITISRKSPLSARLVHYDGVTQKFCFQIWCHAATRKCKRDCAAWIWRLDRLRLAADARFADRATLLHTRAPHQGRALRSLLHTSRASRDARFGPLQLCCAVQSDQTAPPSR